ncbi:MAG: hypothetical protein PHO12_03205 [Bacteroidales bacterium]|nr:hypothetical protein [Bacteroidales bacterium]MDD4684807.1 hypothetical protein [Bacteroidales bacterium]
MKEYTPENIKKLKENEVFVFGSNESGIHAGGAARIAFEDFGAVWGVGYGLEGQTFALPTKDKEIITLPLPKVKTYLKDFIQFVYHNPQLKFYLTKIGCGLAGFTIEEIKTILWEVIEEFETKDPIRYTFPNNLIIPKEFARD